MDKYDGMNRVESTVAPSETVRRKKEEQKGEREKRGGYLRMLICRTVIAGLICGVLFGAKFFSGGKFSFASEAVKEAVCFDAYEYVAAQIKDKEE